VDLVDGCRAAVDAGGAVPVRRRWVRPGPRDSPARKSGSARKPTAQNTTPARGHDRAHAGIGVGNANGKDRSW
jgi:hypothetical protein